jgi:hypothetical protein
MLLNSMKWSGADEWTKAPCKTWLWDEVAITVRDTRVLSLCRFTAAKSVHNQTGECVDLITRVLKNENLQTTSYRLLILQPQRRKQSMLEWRRRLTHFMKEIQCAPFLHYYLRCSRFLCNRFWHLV